LQVDEKLEQAVKALVVVSLKCDRQLRFTIEVKVNRKDFLVRIVVFFKARQRRDFGEFFNLVVAEVKCQVVVVVAECRRKEAPNLVVRNLASSVDHSVSDDGLPDVVVLQIQVLHEDAFVTSLIAVIVLKQSNEVVCH